MIAELYTIREKELTDGSVDSLDRCEPQVHDNVQGKELGVSPQLPRHYRADTVRPDDEIGGRDPAVLGHQSYFVADKLEVLELGVGNQEFRRNVCEHPLVEL